MRPRATLLAASCLAGALLGAELPAQSSTLAGIVHRAGDSTIVISGAEVSVDGVRNVVKTGVDGRFRIGDVPFGVRTLHVRIVGFSPATVPVNVSSDVTLVPPVALAPMAENIGTVVIAGKTVTYPLHFEQQYKRAARGRGYYFTAEQIDSLHPTDTQGLLSLIPTVSVSDGGISFRKCTSSISGLSAQSGGGGSATSNVQVWVDGTRMTRSSGDDPNSILRDIRPSAIQIVEVYSGSSGIPGEYLVDACAVILVWTKRY